MNRTDRLLAILIELQRKQTVTAQSLAGKFETSIRTIHFYNEKNTFTGVFFIIEIS
ncbi:HTH domain-containing protein [Bacillus toyonensis]|uniref:HTH domain-containing protein n=1 Tax=Bacillus toyonensis TaxID=155322 RepID=UPI00028AC2BB|nr:putative DNA-binding protein [Bacillus thuringiensis MC28]MDO8156524.1 HTH domain-containing protein [Bacillus toyonensis]OTX06140.1 HTH domain-containing protein [Bacillus thuringiensis serovar seoulensis]